MDEMERQHPVHHIADLFEAFRAHLMDGVRLHDSVHQRINALRELAHHEEAARYDPKDPEPPPEDRPVLGRPEADASGEGHAAAE